MFKITEQTPTRLVLRERQPLLGGVAGAFTVLSLAALVVIVSQGVGVVLGPDNGDSAIARLLAYFMFLSAIVAFVALGVMATLHFSRGVTCIFDKQDGTLTIEQMRLFRPHRQQRPLYGVSHLDVETNEAARAYGLFIVLRSGERLPLVAVPMLDKDHLETLLRQVRQFLRG